MRPFASLRRQADFARLRRQGRRIASKSFTLYRGDALAGDPISLVGITVSKSIGKAVVRNKLRRRLGAILSQALAPDGAMRLLVVARPVAAQTQFCDLQAELAAALGRDR